MVVTTEEDRLIGQVVDRLLAGFPQVPADTVHEIAGAVHHRFDHAPIRDFIPLFVERHTKGKLANLAGGRHASGLTGLPPWLIVPRQPRWSIPWDN
jgi:hypothetical protein